MHKFAQGYFIWLMRSKVDYGTNKLFFPLAINQILSHISLQNKTQLPILGSTISANTVRDIGNTLHQRQLYMYKFNQNYAVQLSSPNKSAAIST